MKVGGRASPLPHGQRTPLTTGPGNGSLPEAAHLSWFLSDVPTRKRVLTEPLRGGTRRGPNAERKFSARLTSLQIEGSHDIGGGF